MKCLMLVFLLFITKETTVRAWVCPVRGPLICSSRVPNFVITASSSYPSDVSHRPEQSCLDNFAVSGTHIGGWNAGSTDANQWIQVDFESPTLISGIITQGRQDNDQRVTSYSLEYSTDFIEWSLVSDSTGEEIVFSGNNNRDSKIIHFFPEGLTVRYLKLLPRSWYQGISMRWEVQGCQLNQTCADGPCKNNGVCTETNGLISCNCESTGYEGYYCDKDIDECSTYSSLCKVGFSCRNIPGSFVCVKDAVCTPFSGLVCKDQQLISLVTASSTYFASLDYGPKRSCLDNQRLPFNHGGAWFAAVSDVNQWIQADFGTGAALFSVVTQGRPDADSWVTSYKIRYSNDGSAWESFYDNGIEITFSGNVNQYSKIINYLPTTVHARYLRLLITSWNKAIVLRWEVHGCKIYASCSDKPCQNGGKCFERNNVVLCNCDSTGYTGYYCTEDENECETSKPCGNRPCLNLPGSYACDAAPSCPVSNALVCNGREPMAKLTSSSFCAGQIEQGPKQSCLDNFYISYTHIGGWCAAVPDSNQWIQADFGTEKRIISIVTQGRQDFDNWVNAYKIRYSNNGTGWNKIYDNTAELVFVGNNDRKTKVINFLPQAIFARFVRLLPTAWNKYIGMRWEVYGCSQFQTCTPNPCKNGGICESIADSIKCHCEFTGYSGIYCNIDVDECSRSPNPCGSGFTCKNREGSFSCQSDITIIALASVAAVFITAVVVLVIILTCFRMKMRKLREKINEEEYDMPQIKSKASTDTTQAALASDNHRQIETRERKPYETLHT